MRGFCGAMLRKPFAKKPALIIQQQAGGAYTFAYHGLGEVFAVVGLFLVSLEFGISGAAVARSWGDKLAYWLHSLSSDICATETACWVNALNGTSFNPGALFISLVMSGVMMTGVEKEKNAINVLTAIKVALVVFLGVVGALFINAENWRPFLPAAHTLPDGEEFVGGVKGMLMGATQSFFAFIGFDEITCMGSETINPNRNIPLAVMGTIAIITVMYMLISLMLTGMVPYEKIDQQEGLGSAFEYVGAPWAKQVTLVGEILIVLPVVVLVSYAPQTRLLSAASMDRHLPSIFRKHTSGGLLLWNTIIVSVVLAIISAFVPFTNLNDLISGGILLSFIFTNSAIIASRAHDQSISYPLLFLVLLLGALCMVLNKANDVTDVRAIIIVSVLGALSLLTFVFMLLRYSFHVERETYTMFGVPYIPVLAIFCNWYLISQLSNLGLYLCLAFLAAPLLTYILYGYWRAPGFTSTAEDAIIVNEVV